MTPAGSTDKQGSRLLRWALIEAIQRIPRDCAIGAAKDAIIARRGKEAKNIAKVAAARQLLTLVYYGMCDGQIRALAKPAQAPATATAPARPHDLASRPGARPPSILPTARREAAGYSAPRPRRQGAHLIGPA